MYQFGLKRRVSYQDNDELNFAPSLEIAEQHLLETSLAQAILRGEVAENEQAVVWAHGEGEGRQLLVAKEEGQPQQQEPAQQEADPYAQMSWDN